MLETHQTEPLEQPSTKQHEHFFETETVKAALKSKSIRGGAFMLTSGSTNLVLTVVATSILARILMPADFGLLGMVFALTAIAHRFKDIGLGRATIQKKELTHSEVSNLFWLNVAAGIGICLSIAMLSDVIAGFYREPRLTYIAIALSTTFAFGGLTIQHQALLDRRMKFFATGVIGTGSLALSNILAIILALRGYGYWSLVWREIARSMLVTIGTFIACPWVPSLPDLKKRVSQQMRFGRNITLFNIVTYFTSSVDQILLGRFTGASVLGIYRQAFQLVTLPINQLTSPVQSVSEPVFSALQDDGPKYRRGFQKAVSTLSLITMPLAAGIFVCSKPMVLLLLGPRWSGAVDIVKILAVAAFMRPAISTIGFVMVTCGKTGRYLILGILDSIALVAAVSVGVLWGARGVAIGHVAATYVVFLPFVWWALKDTPVDLSLWLRAIARPLACSLFMVAILYVLSGLIPFSNNLAALSVLVPVGVVCYFAGMLVLPGGRLILSELFHDCRSALGVKGELRPSPVA
jgi:O-antigen/teichoic acid export membrane protein